MFPKFIQVRLTSRADNNSSRVDTQGEDYIAGLVFPQVPTHRDEQKDEVKIAAGGGYRERRRRKRGRWS